MQHAQTLREKQWADQRKVDIECKTNTRTESEDAIIVLADKVKHLDTCGPGSARPSHLKLPSFDLEKDRDSFKQ